MHGDSLLDEFRAFIRQEVTAFISRFEDMERTVKSQTRYLISHRRRLNEQEEAIAYLKGHNKGLISRISKLEAELKAMAEIVHRHQETLENMDHDLESVEEDVDSMNDTLQHAANKVRFLDYIPEALSTCMKSFRSLEPEVSKGTVIHSTGPHKNGQECTGPNCYFCESEEVDVGYDVKCEGCDREDCPNCNGEPVSTGCNDKCIYCNDGTEGGCDDNDCCKHGASKHKEKE